MSKYVLGISCGYHDSAACLIKDGVVLGACEEERFTGLKHDNSFPHNTIQWLLNTNKISKEELEAICFYENPELKLDRIGKSTKRGGLFNYFKRKKIISNNENNYKQLLKELDLYKGKNTKIIYNDHHNSHVAYSYFTSPFEESAILSVDGVGEWETTSLYYGQKSTLKRLDSIIFPSSLGMFYSAMTAFLGFKPNEGEYKVMGLAPYGNKKTYLDKLEKVFVQTNNKFEIDMQYFTYDYSDTHMFNTKLSELLEIPNRLPEETLTQEYKDLAASVQTIYEKYFFKLLNELYKKTKSKNLCLSGGCAYNGTANGKIKQKTKFENIWIPPAPSDAGSAIGCGLRYYYTENLSSSRKDNTNPFLGPFYNKNEIKKSLQDFDSDVYYEWLPSDMIPNYVANLIHENNIVGFYQGRMEFGARALGNRSILANPCDPQMKSRLNRVIKKREGFRPFAPMVTQETLTEYFDYDSDIPYMNQVVKVKPNHRKYLPSITHIDGSARVQTVNSYKQKMIYKMLKEFQKVSDYPILINTSFNLKDQTMVLTPTDAIKTFLNCEMDVLILGSYVVKKKIL